MPTSSHVIRCWGSMLIVASLFCTASAASGQFSVSRFTIDGGGGTSSVGATFALGGTLGQPDAGSMSASSFALDGGFWFGGSVAAVAINLPGEGTDDPYNSPLELHLYPARPNPVPERTVVAFDLPAPTVVRVALYDASGRLVRLLVDEPLLGGKHQRAWNRRDRSGRIVSSGIYFLRLDAGTHRSYQKVAVVR